jgi:hypothetical protein
VTSHDAGKSGNKLHLRNLDIDDVFCPPIGDAVVATTQRDDLVRVTAMVARQLLELEATQSSVPIGVAWAREIRGSRRIAVRQLVIVIVVWPDRVSKPLGHLQCGLIELPGDIERTLHLKDLGCFLGFCPELGINRAGLRNVVLEQEVLPPLDLKRHVRASPFQQKRHEKPPV